MRYIAALGVVSLIAGILAGMFGAATWFAGGSLMFGIAMLFAYGYALFNGDSAVGVEPYEIGEEPPEVAPGPAEDELRRKDRGTIHHL